MKTIKTLLLALSLALTCGTLRSAPIDPITAQKAAYNFMLTRPGFDTLKIQNIRLEFTSTRMSDNSGNSFYAFSAGSHGFVIIAADDRVFPVLAYSTTSALEPQALPAPARQLLDGYRQQTVNEQNCTQPLTHEKNAMWDRLVNGRPAVTRKSIQTVGPLISTLWNQRPYYNRYCPYDTIEETNSVTGCVATAMAQIIRYWKWPEHGYGSCAYTHYKYGYLETDYSKNEYKYNNMPIALDKFSSETEIDAVARLMSDCGIGVGMGYSPSGSGSQVMEAGGGRYSAEFVMRNHFGYVYDEAVYKYLIPTQWLRLVKNDLDNGRPIIFRASHEDMGGHCFICDGYDENGMFHFNWGWGGAHDGYYLMDSAYGFNIYQGAIFGLMPPTKLNSHHIVLFSDIIVSSDTIICDDPFEVTVNVQNNGNKPFFGKFRLVLQNGQTLETVTVFDTVSMQNSPIAGETALKHPMRFRGKITNLLSDNYLFRLQYADTNAEEWQYVSEIGDYTNKKSIRFEGGSTSTEIDTITEITSTGATVTALVNSSCSETVTLKAIQYRKNGTSAFTTVKDISESDSLQIRLDKLEPGTTYEVQSYVMVKTGDLFKNYTSQKQQFTTLQNDAVTNFTEKKCRIWPNPSNGTVRISTAGRSARLEVMNTLGQTVSVQHINADPGEIQTDGLPKGMYFIKLDFGTEKIVEKIILE